MRRRKKQNHHDTQEEPDIDLYVGQLHIVPCHADEESNWTFNLLEREVDGHIGGQNKAVGAYAERNIPGIFAGHLYKVTFTANSSLDPLVMTLGGTHVFTLPTGNNRTDHVVYVRPAGDLLKFSHDSGTNFTGAVEKFAIEAMNPIDLDILEIKEFGT